MMLTALLFWICLDYLFFGTLVLYSIPVPSFVSKKNGVYLLTHHSSSPQTPSNIMG